MPQDTHAFSDVFFYSGEETSSIGHYVTMGKLMFARGFRCHGYTNMMICFLPIVYVFLGIKFANSLCFLHGFIGMVAN
jgi:hypothetical protein